MITSGTAKQVAEKYLQYTLQEVYGDETHLESIKQDSEATLEENDKHLTPKELNETPAIDYKVQYGIANNLSEANGWKTGAAEITDVSFINKDHKSKNLFKGGEKVELSVRANIYQDFDSPIIGFLVKDRLGQVLFGENTLPFTTEKPLVASADSKIHATFEFTLPMLPNGEYALMVSLQTEI